MYEIKQTKQERLDAKLVSAAVNGDLEQVSDYLELGGFTERGECRALARAAECGRTEIVRLFLSHGVRLHYIPGLSGAYGHTESIKLLLEHGADVNLHSGTAPLHWAAQTGHAGVVHLLLEYGVDIHRNNDSALQAAVESGHSEIVKLLLEHGADVSSLEDGVLTKVSEDGHAEIVKLLCNNGANVHEKSDSALKRAAKNGHIGSVKALCEHGADVHAQENYALRTAAEDGHTEIVRFLLNNGADIHAISERAIEIVAVRRYTETLKVLLEHGADVKATQGLTEANRGGFQNSPTGIFIALAREIVATEGMNRRTSLRSLIRLAEHESFSIKSNAFDESKETYQQSPIVRLALQDAYLAANICNNGEELAKQVWGELFRNSIAHVERTKGLSYSEYLEQVQAGSAQVAHAKDMFSEVASSYFLPKLLKEYSFMRNPDLLSDTRKVVLTNCLQMLTRGRTSLDIARLSTSWHKAGNQLPDELLPFRAIGSWHKLFDVPFIASNGLEVHALSSPQDLKYEGQALNHCVGSGSYARECRAGRKHILSVRREGIPLGTAELIESGKMNAKLQAGQKYFALGQFLGESNREVPKEVKAAFAEFLKKSKKLSLSTVHGEIKRAKSLDAAVSKLEREIGYPLSEFAKRAPLIEQHYRERVCFHKGHDGKQVVGLFREH